MFENVYEGNAALNTCEMCCTFQVSVATEIADCNWLRIPANFVAHFDDGIPGGRGHKFFPAALVEKYSVFQQVLLACGTLTRGYIYIFFGGGNAYSVPSLDNGCFQKCN